jgi:hypothetical protein
MNIESTELYNTGGGCMILFMDIEHLFMVEPDCQLKQISYDGDCFVGLNCRYQDMEDGIQPENELWGVYDWQELINAVGIDLVLEISKRVKDRWKWSDNVENQDAIRSVEKLIDFTTAASQLMDNWHDNLTVSYPFEKDFESKTIDIFNWQQVVINNLRK